MRIAPHPCTRLKLWVCVALMPALLWAPGASSKPPSNDVAELAKQLARLRAEVDRLASEIDGEKQDQRLRLRTLETQKADVEIELQREKLRLKQIRESIDKYKARIKAASEAQSSLKAPVEKALSAVRSSAQSGLPYRVEDRVSEVDKIERQLKESLIEPAAALARVWAHIEDELRLCRESALDRQIIDLDGKEELVDVIKIGMVMLYFRTGDGRFGWAVREGATEWSYRTVDATSKKELEQMELFFDTFDKKIRTGYHVIPSALGKGVAK